MTSQIHPLLRAQGTHCGMCSEPLSLSPAEEIFHAHLKQAHSVPPSPGASFLATNESSSFHPRCLYALAFANCQTEKNTTHISHESNLELDSFYQGSNRGDEEALFSATDPLSRTDPFPPAYTETDKERLALFPKNLFMQEEEREEDYTARLAGSLARFSNEQTAASYKPGRETKLDFPLYARSLVNYLHTRVNVPGIAKNIPSILEELKKFLPGLSLDWKRGEEEILQDFTGRMLFALLVLRSQLSIAQSGNQSEGEMLQINHAAKGQIELLEQELGKYKNEKDATYLLELCHADARHLN